jgi:hypothetical protein
MSAFVLILAAGMVLGDGPERVSGEVEQGLDLSGRWAGILRTDYGVTREVEIRDEDQEVLIRRDGSLEHYGWFGAWDEGAGRLSMVWRGEFWLGIYKQEDDQLTICIRLGSEVRPTEFTPGDWQNVFILRRVKARK